MKLTHDNIRSSIARQRYLRGVFSLRFSLVLVVVLGVLGYVLVVGLPERGRVISLDREILEKNEVIVDLAAQVIGKRLESLLYIGLMYASKEEVILLVQDGKWAEAALLTSAAIADSGNMIERVFLTDNYGNLQADFPEIPAVHGLNFSYREWFQGYSEQQEPYLSGPYVRTAEPKMRVVALALPIGKNKLGLALGILVFQIQLEKFNELTTSVLESPEHALFIVDRKGMMVCHPSEGLEETDNRDFSGDADVASVISGNSGSQIVSLDGTQHLSSFRSIPPFGWGVVLRTPLDYLDMNSR